MAFLTAGGSLALLHLAMESTTARVVNDGRDCSRHPGGA
jgi:hypothetical protein